MKIFKIIIAIGVLIYPKLIFNKDILIKDLDNDKVSDTIIYNRIESQIICRLSSNNFKSLKSERIENTDSSSGIELTKKGFQFYNNHMREGYTCVFMYNSTKKKIELVGISRYNDGNAKLDGSGESSINLLTNNYIGNWNYFDDSRKKLIKIKTIKTKIKFNKTYLENFSNQQPEEYIEKCFEIYLKNKK